MSLFKAKLKIRFNNINYTEEPSLKPICVDANIGRSTDS